MVEYEAARPIGLNAAFAAAVLGGKHDTDDRVLAFARHRRATTAARVAELEAALRPFAEVAAWADRNGHDLINGFDMLLRHLPGGQFAGHLQVQGADFIAARAALDR